MVNLISKKCQICNNDFICKDRFQVARNKTCSKECSSKLSSITKLSKECFSFNCKSCGAHTEFIYKDRKKKLKLDNNGNEFRGIRCHKCFSNYVKINSIKRYKKNKHELQGSKEERIALDYLKKIGFQAYLNKKLHGPDIYIRKGKGHFKIEVKSLKRRRNKMVSSPIKNTQKNYDGYVFVNKDSNQVFFIDGKSLFERWNKQIWI